ncbi:MAG TPA: ATP-dependent zinc metalloprotease FtsH [Noviherbaspirillum sp.]
MLPLIFLLVQAIASWAGRPELIAYSDFRQLLRAGAVEEISVGKDAVRGSFRVEGADKVLPREQVDAMRRSGKDRQSFVALRVDDPELVKDAVAAGVRVSGEANHDWINELIWWLMLIALFFWLYSRMLKKGGMTGWALDIGKSKARVYMARETGVTFDDVAGIDEAKEELMEVVEFLRNPQRYQRLGGKIPKGVLIVGAPGTGKTLLAKAVAGEAGVPFFSISGSEFVEMFVGVGAARVRDLFAQAEAKAPCIIFIDELDALGRARGIGMIGGHNEQEQTLNQLLVEMDGFDTNKGVIILAATNRPEILDPALLRPGRFDRHVALDRPDMREREKILGVHAKNVPLAPDVDLSAIAARTPGFAGADLANLVNEAALLAARRNRNQVEMRDFDESIDRIVAGLQKKNRVMNPIEKETVAYHEAGHALIAQLRPHADKVMKISIIPRGIAALGYAQQLPTEDRYLLKRAELLDRLDVYLGGRVAEEIVYGDVSTGAQNDLQLATDMARHMVAQYGMSERLGLASYEGRTAPFLHAGLTQERNSYSERTAKAIDREVSQLLDDARARVRESLREHRVTLNALARALLEKESLDREALEALFRNLDDEPETGSDTPVHAKEESHANP